MKKEFVNFIYIYINLTVCLRKNKKCNFSLINCVKITFVFKILFKYWILKFKKTIDFGCLDQLGRDLPVFGFLRRNMSSILDENWLFGHFRDVDVAKRKQIHVSYWTLYLVIRTANWFICRPTYLRDKPTLVFLCFVQLNFLYRLLNYRLIINSGIFIITFETLKKKKWNRR